MESKYAISVNNLSKHFGELVALDNVSMQLEPGLIYGLLGPNGAGKTTFIRLLTGATKATKGSLSLLGLDPQKDKPALRDNLGYMPQLPALYDDLSPRENIRFFGRAHSVKNLNDRVDEVIAFVSLSDRADDQTYKFSGGMKQRVSLACALVHKPDILLLDEPTTGIDPQLRETFWRHFRQLANDGVTLIISTHQMDEALYCDNLAILHRGELLARDTPKNILWDNQATVRVWQGDKMEEMTISNYPDNLPKQLTRFGLNQNITRIEIEEDTLETVILGMINDKQAELHKESADV